MTKIKNTFDKENATFSYVETRSRLHISRTSDLKNIKEKIEGDNITGKVNYRYKFAEMYTLELSSLLELRRQENTFKINNPGITTVNEANHNS